MTTAHTQPTESSTTTGKEVATLGGGCFWCLDAVFAELTGVERIESGYAGGSVPHPSYEQVCRGTTGHAEVAQVTFDPQVTSYQEILEVFFATHDPTTLNRQGADMGTQYRSAIFYHTPEQQATAEQMITELTTAQVWKDPIVTEVVPLTVFYPAEGYHQQFYARNPEQMYCQFVISPKLASFRKKFGAKLRTHG